MTVAHVDGHKVSNAVGAVAVVEDDAVSSGRLEDQEEIEPGESGPSQTRVPEVAGSVERRHLRKH